jgi:HSP20 family molecular chaperone IbpA
MDQQSLVARTAPERPLRLRLIPPELLADRVKSLRETISDRAFEIFSGRRRGEGNALGDWYRAEAELFHAAHVDVIEGDNAVLVRAELPGFGPWDLQVCVEPCSLIITGKRKSQGARETQKIIYSDRCADRIFRVLEFPLELDASKATAILHNGVLELAIPKAAMPSRTWVVAKTDWIVRADDYRAWNELMKMHEVSTTK